MGWLADRMGLESTGDRRRSLLAGVSVAAVFMLVGALAAFGLWRTSVASLEGQLSEDMTRLATIAASMVDVREHRKIIQPEQIDSEAYRAAIGPLRRFRDNAPGVKYVYTARLDGDQVRFVLDAAEPGDHDHDGREDRAEIGEVYEECEDAIFLAFGRDGRGARATSSPQPYSDDWGTFVSGYAPLIDVTGDVVGVIGVDVTADRYLERIAAAQQRAFLGLVPAAMVSLLMGAATFIIRRRTLALQRAEREASESLRESVAQLNDRNAELDRLRIQALAAADAKTTFLANMSHEIRTPLTAVLGYLDLLDESLHSDESPNRAERRSHLTTIRAAGEHLLTLINDVLDLSKIEAGRMTVESVPTDLPRLLAEVANLVRPRAEAKGIRLTLTLASPIPSSVLSDPTRLRQILINLLGNAVKFTEQGSVMLRASLDQEVLRFDVEDSGVGMSEAEAHQLFRPFTQGDASVTRRFGGTGLGLSICRRLAELFGGSVELMRTERGVGSLFTVLLPCRWAPGATLVSSVEESCSANAPSRPDMIQLHGRILLAEDGKDNQRLIAHHLRRAGADVAIAETGLAALRMLDEAESVGAPFDLLLTDVQMPEMDGCTLARTIRTRSQRFPIIALTAHAMSEDRDRCREAGCDDYATKPIDRARLLAVCARWLGVVGPQAHGQNAA